MPEPTSAVPPLPPIALPGGPVWCDLAPVAVLAIAGADATTFLQGQLSNDVSRLTADSVQYTSFNSPKGRMLANFALWRDGDGYRAALPAELAEPVRKRLSMYVLRAKVTLTDVSATCTRLGVGGDGAAGAVTAAFGVAPGPMAVARAGDATVVGLPGPRFLVVAPAAAAAALAARLAPVATSAPATHWAWLTVRAGVPVITTPTQDLLVAQTANWEVLGGVSFQKGCYTGQEIIARTQHLGRLKERTHLFHAAAAVAAGERLYSSAFGEQACGTVINAAPAPAGGTDFLAVVQLAAVDAGDVRLGAPDGPPAALLPLPYAIPAPTPPRGRLA